MAEDSLVDTSSAAGFWLGAVAAALSFVGAWIYCAGQYGFLFGFGLGWLPAAILAAMVFGVLRYLWRLIAIAGLIFGLFLWKANRTIPQPVRDWSLDISPSQSPQTVPVSLKSPY